MEEVKIETKFKLNHIYGYSYFGSGGCYGKVTCGENCQEYGTQDNGFVVGPTGVEVIDRTKPARFFALGGDDIGNGRTWGESAEYVPGQGWWALTRHETKFKSAQERDAWLAGEGPAHPE